MWSNNPVNNCVIGGESAAPPEIFHHHYLYWIQYEKASSCNRIILLEKVDDIIQLLMCNHVLVHKYLDTIWDHKNRVTYATVQLVIQRLHLELCIKLKSDQDWPSSLRRIARNFIKQIFPELNEI